MKTTKGKKTEDNTARSKNKPKKNKHNPQEHRDCTTLVETVQSKHQQPLVHQECTAILQAVQYQAQCAGT